MNVIFQCLGITGLVFIFYGLLAFAITQANTPVFWTILGLGCAFVLAFIVGFFKSQSQSKQSFKDILQSRNLKIGLGSIIYTVIIIFCVIVVAVLSERHYSYQKDFTKNKVHTLSEQTVNVLNELKDPLTVTAFFDERSEAKPIAKELLGKYKEQSKQLAVSFVDPDKDNIAAQQFGAKDGDIVIQYQGQHHVTKEVSEQGLTQAIMKVNRKVLPTVCFITGHGEMDIDASAEDPRSLSFIKEGLSNDGFTSKTVNLIQGVPPECGITVLAGPTQALTNNEAAALDVFLSKGGKSIWMLDPVTADPSQSKSPISVLPTGVEEVAEKWGIILGKNFLLEKQVQLFAGVQIVLSIRAAEYGDHPVVEPIKKRQTVFNHVRSVQKNPAFKGTAIEIIKSAGDGVSWTQSNVDALFRNQKISKSSGDIDGPVPFAVVSEKDLEEVDQKPVRMQLVVFGDSDFASNGMVRGNSPNFDLFLNSVNWLAGEQEKISIRPKAFESSAVELTPEQSNIIFYVTIIGLPMLVLTFGLNLWWYRRRKG